MRTNLINILADDAEVVVAQCYHEYMTYGRISAKTKKKLFQNVLPIVTILGAKELAYKTMKLSFEQEGHIVCSNKK